MRSLLRNALVGIVIGLGVLLGTAAAIHHYRLGAVRDYVDIEMIDTDRNAFLIGLARYVSVEHRGAQAPLEPWYGALSGRRLPAWLRLPTGLLEMLTLAASCDSQARALVYLLRYFGFDAHQFDVFGGGLAHSFARVQIDGRWVILDPYTGVVMQNSKGQLVEFDEMQRLGPENLSITALRPDGPKFLEDTWERFQSSVGAKSGDRIWMPVHLDISRINDKIGINDGKPHKIIASPGIVGIAAQFFGARFGTGKNSIWKLTGGKADRPIVLRFYFTDSLPPKFPVKGASCNWSGNDPFLECKAVFDKSGNTNIQFNFHALTDEYLIDWIEVEQQAKF